ncbi:amidase [Microdochium bolleyi]|uniref:amidase n=1 Tax=Microdochium bolleyi TaxID=196109 RepID=A0A136IQI7_9PEZI|nr:amidase [Microdochium bolleyi]
MDDDPSATAAVDRPWSEIVASKRAIREDLLREHSSTVSDSASSDATGADIVDVSAKELIRAYIGRTNCLTEICFNDALEQARQLDQFQQTHGRPMGPLHGVPISVKDQFNVKGFDSTLGYVGNAFQPAEADAPLVQTLKRLGAVIIAKTNLPQSIMTDNPLWGLTTHPSDPKLTPGGSSGGEAAPLSLAGSLVGFGTDIGGSIRIPSHTMGFGSGRLSYRGVSVTLDGQQHVPSSVGPMARSLSALAEVMKLAIEAEPWTTDPLIPPLPWREKVFQEFCTRKLVIGTMLDDGMVRPHPPIERVFSDLAAKLRAAGHGLVEWSSSANADCIQIMDDYYAADGGEDIRRGVAAGGEPFIPHIQAFVERGQPISVYEYWQLNKRKVASQQAYHDMWDTVRSPSGRPVDVLLVPTMPHTAVPHGSCRWTGYTKLFNFPDYTALTFPAGKADGLDVPRDELDSRPPARHQHDPRNPIDAANWDLYDPRAMCSLPIGLQIVGRRFEEEKVLGVASQVQKVL